VANGETALQKILIVDDDRQMIGLHRMRLSDSYEIIETMEPEEALGLALQHKPAAILLDLMMPKFSGFELCQSLHSLSYTSMIPIFVITGESAAKYKEHCEGLGAKAYFEKPVDYHQLKIKLASELETKRPERREHVRVRMRVILNLKTINAPEKSNIAVATENVSAGGFLCTCSVFLRQDSIMNVFLTGIQETHVGRARIVRVEASGTSWQRYGFQFIETTSDWILQSR
jgi:response regulator RpfG family c-di-GMP phosphodiesterase